MARINDQRLEVHGTVAVAVWLALSLIDGPTPVMQALQNGPTVVALAVIFWAARREWLSRRAIACLLAFWALHILGARYAYSNVPYDEWSRALFGTPLSEIFGWRRNHFDRLVHFLFGALWMIPLTDWAVERGQITRRWAVLFAWGWVSALGAMYEVFEWGLTLVMSPENAHAYNGQQGDFWDAQKDLALAALGATLAIPWALLEPRAASEDSHAHGKTNPPE